MVRARNHDDALVVENFLLHMHCVNRRARLCNHEVDSAGVEIAVDGKGVTQYHIKHNARILPDKPANDC